MAQPAGAPPVGSQINGDYQYEYRGLKIGNSTPYVTTKVDGILTMPPIVQYHSKALSKHGIYYGYEVFDMRTIDFDVMAHAEPGDYFVGGVNLGVACEKLVDDFNNAFAISGVYANELTIPLAQSAVDDPLVIKRPGKLARQIFCHVTKRALTSTGDVAMGLADIALEMIAGDPLVYSLITGTANTTIPSGNTTSTAMTINSLGNLPTPRVVFTISGPGGGGGGSELWTISNTAGGVTTTIRLNMVLVGTDHVVIDLAAKTILLNGVDSYSFRRPDSDWWLLQPGSNVITLTRSTTDGVASTISMTYLDAWNSA